MFGFIIAVSLVFGVIIGLMRTVANVPTGGVIERGHWLTGLASGLWAAAAAFAALMLLWAIGSLLWWIVAGLV